MSPTQTLADLSPAAEVERPRLVILTGLSGSGKSTAAKALEDLGYYCVDNLPLNLLRIFLAKPFEHVRGQKKVAVVTDVRATGFAEEMPQILSEVRRDDLDLLIVFFEASEEALIRRFSETRRSHPLGGGEGRPLISGIRREKKLLTELRGVADLVFDTSDWSVHDARRVLYRELGEVVSAGSMSVSLISFGFKYGIPSGSDLVFDVRFLPNPYFQPNLREQSGRDAEVREFLDRQEDFAELAARLEDLLLFLLPRYQRENRAYLTVAIGCTGGRHRSVATVERLSERLKVQGSKIRSHHRDIER